MPPLTSSLTGAIAASMFSEHFADASGTALKRLSTGRSSGGKVSDFSISHAQRPASFIWSRDFQREDARVVVMIFMPRSCA
jgi:hypothetical protein